MPFTDQELAESMNSLLITQNVINNDDDLINALNDDCNEYKINELSNQGQVTLDNFDGYWGTLGNWINDNNGDFQTIGANNLEGRDNGGNNVNDIQLAIYNDVFRDVRNAIANDNLSRIKAISNHLRFIKLFSANEELSTNPNPNQNNEELDNLNV